jgi:hypothetical protein
MDSVANTLFPMVFGLIILVAQYYYCWRDYSINGNDRHCEEVLPELIQRTTTFEKFVRLGLIILMAKLTADFLRHVSFRNDVALLLLGLAYAIVLYRKRRFLAKWQRIYEQRARIRQQLTR